ncbi:cupin domain-containing protein [Paenarthrobacter aromaticivorans]|uniref:cupin domain-containing protein n=1 Tax=Paenarthrobacter aromaticivorans TaxID=2849150 RepID=UPI003A803DD1
MEVIRAGETGFVYGGSFTGPVGLEMLLQASTDQGPDIARVTFTDGAVTNWHRHPGGQLLYLLSGVGRVGAGSTSTASIEPGTLVRTPEDERHWHGADAGNDAVWLAMTWGTTDWEDRSPE